MSRWFDDLTRKAASTRSRREVLGLVGKAVIGTAVGGGALLLLDVPMVSAESCITEYPPQDLDNCPNKRPHPGNVRQSNGCGAEGSTLPVPQGFGDADFRPGCNNHDICWETCNKSKAGCDISFGNDLKSACLSTYGLFSLKFAACIQAANFYELGVTVAGGDAYDAAQKKDCECCFPTKVYCPCNHTCYPASDVSTCLSECHTSLGCFVNICGPASLADCP